MWPRYCARRPPALHASSRAFNRKSVQRALRQAQQQVKLLNNRLPPTGVMIFCGEDVAMTVHPPLRVTRATYLCDRRFHTEVLEEMMEDRPLFGFVICDGQAASLHSLVGKEHKLLQTVHSTAKGRTRRGGQSSGRFARQREGQEWEYVKDICDAMSAVFLNDDGKSPYTGLVLGGKANIKRMVESAPDLDPRVKRLVVATVELSCTGEAGLAEAIEKTEQSRHRAAGAVEDEVMQTFETEIQKQSAMVCYGLQETLFAIETHAVKTLFLNPKTFQSRPAPNLAAKQQAVANQFDALHSNDSNDYDGDVAAAPAAAAAHSAGEAEDGPAADGLSFLDWATEAVQAYGGQVFLVKGLSDKGALFNRDFGGIGGMLFYPVTQDGGEAAQ
eukprot:m.12013 g.12013  ORF g.12013 m.12013 type:complete len:387 (-) comp6671_c0_seq1:49-1209(-)